MHTSPASLSHFQTIDLRQGSHVRYWTTLLDCSEVCLREAVGTVGTCAYQVRAYLYKAQMQVAQVPTEHERIYEQIRATILLLQERLHLL